LDEIRDILKNVFTELQSPLKTKRSLLLEKWPQIVGDKWAKHTKPAYRQDGNITIWVDESTLAFELKQRYQPALVKRIEAVLGKDTVKNIRFYVGQIR